jgi:hypothetical protein
MRANDPILIPAIYANPFFVGINWLSVTRVDVARANAMQRAANRRLVVGPGRQNNPAAQNAIAMQMHKMLEPILKTELSFAARAADLNRDERRKLVEEGKKWFEKFVVDFTKNQDPNQQQMFMQGIQGVWFGNQRQKAENPRDSVRAGIAKVVAATLPKEKAAAYSEECRKRDEFYRQVSIDNVVERLDDRVKLSPEQWKKVAKSLNDHWDKNQAPQVEAFVLVGSSMWPGMPDQFVLSDLSPAQQGVLKRMNTSSGQMFFSNGVFGNMMGGEAAVIDDIELNVQPGAAADNPFSE